MQGPKGDAGPAGATGPAGPQGIPGTADISFSTTDEGRISVITSSFAATWWSSMAVDQMIADRALKTHKHTAADITDVEQCVGPVNNAICFADAQTLMVKGQLFVAAPLVDGKAVHMDYLPALTLSGTNGTNIWTAIGSYSTSGRKILTVSGSVRFADGSEVAVNGSDQMRVRIVAGRIQETHVPFQLNGQALTLVVSYTSL